MKLEACKKCPHRLKCILLGPQTAQCALHMAVLASSCSCNEFAQALYKLLNVKEKV